MSDTYTILYDPSPNRYFKYALIKPDGTVCQWSPRLDNLSTAKGDYSMQSPTYHTNYGYLKLTLPSWVTTKEQLVQVYPELFV